MYRYVAKVPAPFNRYMSNFEAFEALCLTNIGSVVLLVLLN